MSNCPTLVALPMPSRIEVGDMFGSVFHEELVIVVQVSERENKRLLMPHFGIEIEERDIIAAGDGGYAYLGRMPEVFLGKMKEELGIEDAGADDGDDEDDGDFERGDGCIVCGPENDCECDDGPPNSEDIDADEEGEG